MARLVDTTEQRSLRQQAQDTAADKIRAALGAERDAHDTYRQRQRETADAIAVARAEGVPWAVICDALGGINRSSAVLRLNVHSSRAAAPTRAVPDIAAPTTRQAIDEATLTAAPEAAVTWWQHPTVTAAVNEAIQAVTDQKRQAMLTDGAYSTVIVATLNSIATTATTAAFDAVVQLAGTTPHAGEGQAALVAASAVRHATR